MREFLTILKVLWVVWVWEPIMRVLGIGPCCDNMQLEERICTPCYWEYECKNCGTKRSGSPSRF